MAFVARPAQRTRKKARACLDGVSGTGKSFTGLAIARGIVGPDGKIGVIDTEGGSILAYAGLFPGTAQPSGFDHGELTSNSPDAYLEAIKYFESKRTDLIMIDSGSHEWAGEGGVLELVDANHDKFGKGWREATPKHNKWLRAIIASPAHMLVTLRAHDEYVIEKDERGTNVPRKIGLAPVARKGTDYEFDFIGRMDLERHHLRVMKSRMHGFLAAGNIVPLGDDPTGQSTVEFGRQIRAWLDAGDGEWQAPAFRTAFYVGEREIISAGVDRATYVKCMNLAVALERLAKGEAVRLRNELGKAKVEDCTQDEGERLAAALDARIKEVASAKQGSAA